MGKRRKKKMDARGYSTSSTPSRKPATPASEPTTNASGKSDTTVNASQKQKSQAPSNIYTQEVQTCNNSNNKTTSASVKFRATPRFITRLQSIVSQLQSLGVSMPQLERICESVSPTQFYLPQILDWMCLHMSMDELPAVLLPDRTHFTTEGDVELVLHEPSANAALDKHERLLLDTAPKHTETQRNNNQTQQEELSTEQKKQMILNYQYLQEEQQHQQHKNNNDATLDANSQADDAPSSELTKLQQQLQTLRADLKDDAANYMRSKLELKDLKNQVTAVQRQIQRLQKYEQRTRKKDQEAQDELDREVAAELAQEHTKIATGISKVTSTTADGDSSKHNENGAALEHDQSDAGGGLFDLFDEDAPPTTTTPAPSSTTPPEDDDNETDIDIPLNAIPPSWTGSNPQQMLQEWSQKQKFPPPRYQAQNNNQTCHLTVARQRPTTKDTELHLTFSLSSATVTGNAKTKKKRYQLLCSYTATRALYELLPDQPLYQRLPPFHREAWLEWKAQAQAKVDLVKAEEQRGVQQVTDRLVSILEQHEVTKSTEDDERDAFVSQQDDLSFPNPGQSSWDDDDLDMAHPTTNEPQSTISDKGRILQESFLKQQTMPAYKSMLHQRQALPMYQYRSHLLSSLDNNPVTVLCAETGAGKTTQAPQYILEQSLLDGRGDQTFILCTQPRRVAAISVAERVSDEMADSHGVGGRVGYQIRLESKKSAQTQLLFCTTGVVLRRLQEDPTLKGVSHVVVDEVHERQWQIDLLLVVLQRLVRTQRRDLKIVLMSATLDAELFCSFFGGAPLIQVPGRTFPVTNCYLEDLLEATGHVVEEDSRYAKRGAYDSSRTASLWVTGKGGEKHKETVALDADWKPADVSDDGFFEGYSMQTRRSMDRVDETVLNFDLVEDVLQYLLINHNSETEDILVPPEGSDISNGSILIFLPGIGEIRSLTERLQAHRHLGDARRFDILPLHSALSPKDQRRAFAKPKGPAGCRKIIVSTNIAETSVTIPDVTIVLDCGRVKEISQNKRTSTSTLKMQWCSRASVKQRAGRAGRVQPGLCLKLFSSRTQQLIMKEAQEPELRRVPLEEVCLMILASGFAPTSCMEFLSHAPEPPAEVAVQNALNALKNVGAVTWNEEDVIRKESLTPLGVHLAKLPVDVHLSKMLIFASLFGCLGPILTIAASLSSSKSLFSRPWGDTLQEATARHRRFTDENSDFMTHVNLWEAYRTEAIEGRAWQFCKQNYLSRSALDEIRDAREQFLDLLCRIGFVKSNQLPQPDNKSNNHKQKRHWSEPDSSLGGYNRNGQVPSVVDAVITAGFYPNIAQLLPSPSMPRELWHKKEQLHFASTSVHAKMTKTHGSGGWFVFWEKFGTAHRVQIGTACPTYPFALLLFGGTMQVVHLERKVVMDGWMELQMAAFTAVRLREERTQLEAFLKSTMDGDGKEKQGAIDDIVDLLTNNTENIPQKS